MLYLIAILIPSLGMFLSGRMAQALICLLLQFTCIGWPIAAIWACFVVADSISKKRHAQVMAVVRQHRE